MMPSVLQAGVYTEGIGYYSKKQVLHGFLDRVSKNGNLLLNISPKADGTIPQEQKDILLSMGAWLKKIRGGCICNPRLGKIWRRANENGSCSWRVPGSGRRYIKRYSIHKVER
jgi:alpha-L-fucosidase